MNKKILNSVFIYVFILSVFFINASSDETIKLEDDSGLSEKELLEKVNKDEEDKQIISNISNIINSKTQTWENSAPKTQSYDWVELTSGEWMKGSFKAIYERELEFDSKEFKLQTFDLSKVKQVRTHKVVTVNIHIDNDKKDGFFNLQPKNLEVSGILRMKDNNITIIQGDKTLHFTRDELISIANGGESERQYWSGKLTFSLDVKKGNTEQLNYTADAYVMRRTSKTRLRISYLGNISRTNNIETSNNNRINEKFDLFLSKQFYVTALTLEYYDDIYQNIQTQWTYGAAIGYSIIHNKDIEWDLSLGPAIVETSYYTVESDVDNTNRSWAMQIQTLLDMEITKKMDFIFDYRITKMDKISGDFKHHMVVKSENEITTWLDFDVTLVWDYLQSPTSDINGELPERNDYQLLVGIGVEF